MNLINSETWWARGEKVLAGGSATLSKNADRFAQGVTPRFLEHGMAGHVWDIDGNELIDTVAGLGPILLGYHHPDVDMAVRQQVRDGPIFSLPHPLEVELAEQLCEVIPCAEMVRFGKNGMDVTNAAVRLARFVTGKKHAIFCGYHGGMDSYIATTKNNGGVLWANKLYNHQIKWGDYKGLQDLLDDRDIPDLCPECQWGDDLVNVGQSLAAIMVEVPPLPWESHTQDEDVLAFLGYLLATAKKSGALFILDEVVTGGRSLGFCAQKQYGIIPDLACFSKGMANGFPFAALVGHRDLMGAFDAGKVFFSTTFGGDAIGLAAAHATLQVLRRTDALETLHARGQLIGDGLAEAIKYHDVPCDLLGNSARMALKFRDLADVPAAAMKTLWLQETIKKNVIFGGPLFPMALHTESDAHRIVYAADHGFRMVRRALMSGDFMRHLECPIIEDVFGQRYNHAKGVS